MIISAVYMLFHRVKIAWIYLLGWAPLFTMFFILALRQLTGINILGFFPYFEEFAISFEAIVFSVALSLRVRKINTQKKNAIRQLLLNEKELSNKLQTEVDKKTQELQENLKEKELLLAEVNHRVKNNMQMIISMLRLQADDQDDQFKELVTIAENRIISLLSIHELVYKNKEFTSINTSNYLHEFIDALVKSFSYDEKALDINIEPIQLDIDSLIQSTLIINELVTNAIKYAINPNGVKIYIGMKTVNEHVELEVSDNGTDIEKNMPKGFGALFTIRTVKSVLRGTIKTSTENGYKTTITFPLKKV